VGGCCAVLAPLLRRVEAHVFAAERLHSDDTTVPVLAKGKTDTGRCWVYVRDDRPFGQDPPAAMFYYSRDRAGEHAQAHLADYAGIFQADAFGGYNRLYEADRKPGQIVEAACWVHARRPFFQMGDLAATARRRAQGKTLAVISPLALEAIRRIDALFEIERSINGQSAERRRAVRQELAPLWSPIWKAGYASSAPSCRAATISPRQWITCSNAGRPSPASLTTAASASATMPPSAPCAALPWGAGHGCSPVPTAAANAPRRCTR
jgi:hypothetical protein